MKISIDTETEELEELRHTLAIIEDALKRRESPDYDENSSESAETEEETSQESYENLSGEYETPTEPQPEPAPVPEVDMSSLTMSDYGETNENRKMETPIPKTSSPQQDSKKLVKDIILSIRNQNPGQPIQMQEIISKAAEKNISESSTRNFVSELQKEGAI